MKTIYYYFNENYPADQMVVTGETEKSYVVCFPDTPEIEICASKLEEGKKWFWTKEESDSTFKSKREIQAKIDELKKQL